MTGIIVNLGTFISNHRETILNAWCDVAASVYPNDMRTLTLSKKDAFTNPCGQNLYQDLAAFLKGLEEGKTADGLSATLHQTIKIRSIQNLAPSAALHFIFDLKQILLDRYQAQSPDENSLKVVWEWSKLLDAAAGAAFNEYEMQCRLLGEVRINELKRSVAGLAAQTRFFAENA